MSLSSVIKIKETKNYSSSKGPQYYNSEKSKFIVDMVNNEDSNVRLIALSNEHCPSRMLQTRLNAEKDTDCIKAILMNPNLSKKTLVMFATQDPRASQFDDDDELIDYIDSLNLEQ